jgi:hypothetical protein
MYKLFVGRSIVNGSTAGLFAFEYIPQGANIVEYTGKIIVE